MIKTYLKDLLDIQFILILVILLGVTMVLTMVFSDKVKDFKQNYKRKFTIYVLSLVFGYVLVSLLGFNKLFDELGDEFLFYQLASLLFGIVHAYFYRWYFDSFDSKSLPLEIFFSVVVILYGGFPFMIIYTALHGLNFTYLLCGHFLAFIIPTGVYITFELMMRIPPKIYMTWELPRNEDAFPAIEDSELKEVFLITLLIKKKETDKEYQKISDMVDNEKLHITPLAYIRGRSLSNICFIIDEAQNLTPHEVKTIITRAGENTKIIFTGDVNQIDTPYLDSHSNGLSHIIDKIKDNPLYAHITLERGERSELANLAGALL